MQAKSLIVYGSSRFLNTLYANDLTVSGTTTFAGINASSLAVSGNATINGTTTLKGTKLTGTLTIVNTASSNTDTIGLVVGGDGTGNRTRVMSDGLQAVNSDGVKQLYLNYWGGVVSLGSGNQITANNGTFTTPTLNATKSTINNLYVPNELRAVNYNIETVSHLGGAFFVAPSIEVPAGNNVSITAISGNTITATISDNSITTTAFSPTWWCANSLVKIAGSIAGIPIGTCNGTLTSALVAGRVVVQFTYTGQSEKPLSVANSQASSGLSVTLTTIGGTKPIGIYMTALGQNNWADSTALNKTAISIYGGTTDGAIPDSTNPVVRIGNLAGLPSVNNEQPVGWGIYTNHGYFSGLIVSNSGKIGNFTISDALYSTAKAFGTTANNVYIGDDGISLGTTFKVTKAGELTTTSGNIANWSISSNSLTTGTWGTDSSAMLCTGTSSSKSIGGSSSINGWVFTAGANFGVTKAGALYANSANITGTITATTGTFGNGTNKITVGNGGTANSAIYYGMTTLASTTATGFYIGTDGIALGGGKFKVTNAGALSATSGSIGGSVTIGGTAASTILSNITNAAKTATNYLTTISGTTGISVHDSGDTSNFVNMNSNGVFVYKGGTQRAQFADTTIIGKPFVDGASDNESHIEIDYHSFKMADKEGGDFSNYVYFSDLRGTNGITEIHDNFVGDGTTKDFYLSLEPTDTSYTVKVNGTIVTSEVVKFGNAASFNTAPAASSTIEIIYNTTDRRAKSFTLGSRKTNSTIGPMSVAVGYNVAAEGTYSFVEGEENTSSGRSSHAEGRLTEASGDTSHAEGNETMAIASHSHAEGYSTTSSGNSSHSEGVQTTASGVGSHAGGYMSEANGDYSFASGLYTYANMNYQTSIGVYNLPSEVVNDFISGLITLGYTYTKTIDISSIQDKSHISVHLYGNGVYGQNEIIYSWSISGNTLTLTYRCPDPNPQSGEETDVSVYYNVIIASYGYAFVVGNGQSNQHRSNAFGVDWSGNTVMAGALTTTGITSTGNISTSGTLTSTGNINTSGTYQKGGSDFITTQSFDLGTISITAGTPGTVSTTITKTITKTGYTPIAVKIRYVSNSIIGFNAFFSEGNASLYVQVIRRQSGASSPGYKAYADVTYIKT